MSLPSVRGSDLPQGDEGWLDQYVDEQDTPANRVKLAAGMADDAFQQIATPMRGINQLTALIASWLETVDADDRVRWMAQHGIVPTYDAWAEPDPPEPERDVEAWG